MTTVKLVDLITIVFFFLASAFFSAMETAFTSISIGSEERILHKGGKKAKRISFFLENRELYLTTVLIGNNIANITISVISTKLVASFINIPTFVVSVVLTIAIVIISEILPKQIALFYNEFFLEHFIFAIRICYFIFRPLIWLISFFTRLVKLLNRKHPAKPDLDDHVLQLLLSRAEGMNVINRETAKTAKKILKLKDLSVKTAMIHRKNLKSFSSKKSIFELCKEAYLMKENYFLIHQDSDMEHILGIVDLKDVLGAYVDGKDAPVMSILRRVRIIHENKKLLEAIELFRESKESIFVIDEYGVFLGILTTDNILEETMKVNLRNVQAKSDITVMKNGKFILNAHISLYEFQDYFKLKIKDAGDGSISLGLYIMNKIGRLPKNKEIITFPFGIFKILTVKDRELKRLEFQLNK